MEEVKNKKNSKSIIIVTVGIIIGLGLALFCIFTQFLGKNNQNLNRRDALSDKFQKNLFENLNEYLLEDDRLEKMKKNETLTVSSKKIISAKEFDNCSGNTKIKKIEDGYQIVINYQCKNAKKREITYLLYSHEEEEWDNSYILEDSIFVSMMKDIETGKNAYDITNNSLIFRVFDTKGNLTWSASFAKNQSGKDTQNMVDDVKKIGDHYYVFVNSFLRGEYSKEYLLSYDVKGNLLKQEELEKPINFAEYIGEWEGEYYYNLPTYNPMTNNLLILKKDGTHHYLEMTEEEHKDLDDYLSNYGLGMIDNNLYTVMDNSGYETLAKANLKGKKIRSKDILDSSKYVVDGMGIVTTDKYIFVPYYAVDEEVEGEYSDIYFKRYNTDLNESSPKYDYRKDVLKEFEEWYGKEVSDNYYEEEVFVDNNKLNILLCDEEDNYGCYLITTDDNFKVLDMIKVDGEEFLTNYSTVSAERVLKDNTVVTVANDSEGEFVLAFYR